MLGEQFMKLRWTWTRIPVEGVGVIDAFRETLRSGLRCPRQTGWIFSEDSGGKRDRAGYRDSSGESPCSTCVSFHGGWLDCVGLICIKTYTDLSALSR